MKVALVQMRSSSDPWENLARVKNFVAQAESQNAQAIFFPENVFYRGPLRPAEREEFYLSRAGSGVQPDTEFARAVEECRATWKIAVSLGAVLEKSELLKKPYNSHWFFTPDGSLESYQKIHLFDYSGAQSRYHESAEVRAGDKIKTVSWQGLNFGLSICFDLRFPELYRQLAMAQGAEVLLVPAAFTRETGQAHWHILLKARAIENLCFVIASAQWGSHLNARGQELFCYGHSLVIDPWGQILAEAPAEGDGLFFADLSLELLRQRRDQLPVYQSAKLFQSIDSTSINSAL